MKKFISQIIIFGLFAAVIYFIGINVWGRYAPKFMKGNIQYKSGSHGYTGTRMSDAEQHGSTDILFVGSSHCYRGYDPRIFARENYTSFNLGSSSQTPLQTKLLLDRYLEKFSPKLIVIDVYPIVMGNDGVESTLDFLGNMPIKKDLVGLSLSSRNTLVYNTLIYRFTRQKMGWDTISVSREPKGKDSYVAGGFVENNSTYTPATGYKKKHLNFSEDQLEALVEIVEKIRAAKINYVLVQSPIPALRYKSFDNNKEIDARLYELGEYYNFNELKPLADSLFFDDSHMNQQGVEVFNTRLIELLKMSGVLWKETTGEIPKEMGQLLH